MCGCEPRGYAAATVTRCGAIRKTEPRPLGPIGCLKYRIGLRLHDGSRTSRCRRESPTCHAVPSSTLVDERSSLAICRWDDRRHSPSSVCRSGNARARGCRAMVAAALRRPTAPEDRDPSRFYPCESYAGM